MKNKTLSNEIQKLVQCRRIQINSKKKKRDTKMKLKLNSPPYFSALLSSTRNSISLYINWKDRAIVQTKRKRGAFFSSLFVLLSGLEIEFGNRVSERASVRVF